ncbi:uncharacterized protein LTR77_009906 [Saxophila tyrrhenica]|uniref:Rhodopsin domain-containing protein n=1 Tax=Saxophila tyrrhenica TaxID=1690608 RepID=A0AAV9NZT2_9PEZI|nr:hypothetical protein LTR77_009906 [Saxophila tyrrhenica]
MDLYLAVYPAIVLAKLQMNIKKKLALCGALGIGCVGCVVAAYKCTRLPGLATSDFSWNTSQLVIWTSVEGSTIIIASCIPIMQPLLKAISTHCLSTGGRNYQDGHLYAIHGADTPGVQLSSEMGKPSKWRSRARVSARHTTEVDSQESILRDEQLPVQAPRHSGKRLSRGWIERTDEVTVTSSWGDGGPGRDTKMPWG